MSKFVLCESFVKGCVGDTSFYCDVLFEFTKDNPLAVYIDSPTGNVLNSYRSVAERDESNLASTWLKCMINRDAVSFEPTAVATDGGKSLFFQLADRIGPGTPIVVWSTVEWSAERTTYHNPVVLDRMKGKKAIRRGAKGKEAVKVAKKTRSGGIHIVASNVNANIHSEGATAQQSIDIFP